MLARTDRRESGVLSLEEKVVQEPEVEAREGRRAGGGVHIVPAGALTVRSALVTQLADRATEVAVTRHTPRPRIIELRLGGGGREWLAELPLELRQCCYLAHIAALSL